MAQLLNACSEASHNSCLFLFAELFKKIAFIFQRSFSFTEKGLWKVLRVST